jgi:hypothetical protein
MAVVTGPRGQRTPRVGFETTAAMESGCGARTAGAAPEDRNRLAGLPASFGIPSAGSERGSQPSPTGVTVKGSHIREIGRAELESMLGMYERAWHDAVGESLTSAEFYERRYLTGEVDSLMAMAWASYYEQWMRLEGSGREPQAEGAFPPTRSSVSSTVRGESASRPGNTNEAA